MHRHKGVSCLRVLVVDDNRDTADSMALILRLYGHEVVSAYSSSDAYQAVQTCLPDVLLLDIGLPGEDGWHLAKRLRGLFPRQPLVIAISGHGMRSDVQRSEDEGFAFHFIKPVDPSIIIGLLHRYAISLRKGEKVLASG